MPIGMADHPQSPLVWSLLVMMLDQSSQKVCFFPFSGLSDSSLPRDWTWAMAVKALSPNQWTARKFPQKHLLGMQSGIITLQNSSVVSYKVKNTYFTTQEPLLGVYPKEMKRFTHEKTCLQMFIVALFITTTNWKQSHCLSTGEGMKRNVVNPYTGILLSKKQEETAIQTQTWMHLKCMMMFERSQTQKVTYGRIASLWHSKEGKPIGMANSTVVSRS